MRFEIRRLHDEYRYTTVYVTHDQSEAMTTADLIAVMNAGQIEQLGSPEEIYDRPRSEFVARFIGGEQHPRGQGARCRTHVESRASPLALHRRDADGGRDARRSRSASTRSRCPPTQPAVGGNVLPATVVAAGLPRHSRDYMVALADGTQLRVVDLAGRRVSRRAQRSGCTLPPERCRALAGERMTSTE